MSFPPGFLDELRTRVPLSGLVGRRVKLVRAGREFKGCCPFHHEKTPSFYVNDDKQFFHCFGCGAHGDVIGFTMRHDGLSFPEAIEALAAQAGLSVPRDTPVEREKFDQEKRLHQLLERATAWFESQLTSPAGAEARAYLARRGLGEEAARRFRLGYAPNDGSALLRALGAEGYKPEELVQVGLARKAEERNEYFSFFRHRLMFPVGDRRGRTVAFGGRVLGEGEPKYLNSPDHPLFHKGKLLYGLSRARGAVPQNQTLIVVEGYMDVIALAEAGFTGAVAPLGTAMTEDQMALLWSLLPPLETRDPGRDMTPVLCFDGDSAGLRAAGRAVERALPLLTPAHSFRLALMPEGEDPDSLIRRSGRGAMQAVLDQARPMIDAVWDLTLEGRRLQTPEERAAFMGALRQKVNRIADESLRALYHEAMRQRLSGAFQWAGRDQRTPPQERWENRRTGHRGAFRGGGKGWAPLPPPEPPLKAPRQARHLREQVLLALMINHPHLFAAHGEDFAQVAFADPKADALRQRIVEILSSDSHETLDAAELYRHLSQEAEGMPWRQALSEALAEGTYLRAGFARPDRSPDEARKGWKAIWNHYVQELIRAELQDAQRRCAEDASDASLNRLLALRSQAEASARESALYETDETGPEAEETPPGHRALR